MHLFKGGCEAAGQSGNKSVPVATQKRPSDSKQTGTNSFKTSGRRFPLFSSDLGVESEVINKTRVNENQRGHPRIICTSVTTGFSFLTRSYSR